MRRVALVIVFAAGMALCGYTTAVTVMAMKVRVVTDPAAFAHRLMPMLQKKLNLDPGQAKQVAQIMMELRTSLNEVGGREVDQWNDLLDEFPTATSAELNRKMADINQSDADRNAARLEYIERVGALLSVEQRKKFAEIVRKRVRGSRG